MKFGKWLVTVLAGGCLFIVGPGLRATQTATLSCVADTSLFEENPDNNLGGMLFLPIGRSDTGFRARAVYKFTVADTLPAGSVIRDATLELEVVDGQLTEDRTFVVHRLLRAWGEGNKTGGQIGDDTLGAPATAGEATWNARVAPSTLWSAPGGASSADYISAESASEILSGAERYFFTSSTLIADVQRWLDNPGTNFGWVVKIQDERFTNTALMFGSREDSSAAPVLRVQYDPPGQIHPQIQNVRLTQGSVEFQFRAESNTTYFIEYTSDFNRWLQLGIPIFPGPTRMITISDPASNGSRFYRIVGF